MEKKEPKKRTSFSLSKECIEQLNKLSKKNNRSMANMLEVLILKESIL